MDKIEESRESAEGYYGWPNVKIEDEVKKNDDGTYTVTALFVRNYRPTVLCIACCTGTPMKLLMNVRDSSFVCV